MEVKELMIGNYLQNKSDKRIGKVIRFSSNRIQLKMELSTLTQSNKSFEPIPLTEDWLLRFGFRKADESDEFGGYVSSELPNGC